MPTTDPWAFGLNHLLTISGFLLTVTIAVAGFRTFGKWKREKIEERRIDIALEAMALAYESGYIFDGIRSPISFESEWSELEVAGDAEARRRGGPFFAVVKRIERQKDYFERLWRLQPRFMAMFGADAAPIFMELHKARRSVEVSAGMLLQAAVKNEPYRDAEFRDQLENDIWNVDAKRDRIGPRIKTFVNGIEERCAPVVSHRFAKK